MRTLRYATAATVMVGPFVDAADAVTEEVLLAGNGTELSKNGAAFGAGPVLGTHDAEGYYPVALTTGSTDTLGHLLLKSHAAATHRPVKEEFMVVPSWLYDRLTDADDAWVELAGLAVAAIRSAGQVPGGGGRI